MIKNKLIFILLLPFICFANENAYDALFVKYSKIHRIPSQLLWAIAKTESNFNPSAINKANDNGTYDIGLMQVNSIHEENLKKLGLTLNDLYDPEINVRYASAYLAKCFKKWGFNYKGLNCYNGRISNNNYNIKVLNELRKKQKIVYKNTNAIIK